MCCWGWFWELCCLGDAGLLKLGALLLQCCWGAAGGAVGCLATVLLGVLLGCCWGCSLELCNSAAGGAAAVLQGVLIGAPGNSAAVCATAVELGVLLGVLLWGVLLIVLLGARQ